MFMKTSKPKLPPKKQLDEERKEREEKENKKNKEKLFNFYSSMTPEQFQMLVDFNPKLSQLTKEDPDLKKVLEDPSKVKEFLSKIYFYKR